MNWHLRVCSVWDSTQECNDTRHKKNVEEANVVECERRKWKKVYQHGKARKKSKCLHIRKEEKEFQARILKTSCMSQCTSISTHVSVFHACRITFFILKVLVIHVWRLIQLWYLIPERLGCITIWFVLKFKLNRLKCIKIWVDVKREQF